MNQLVPWLEHMHDGVGAARQGRHRLHYLAAAGAIGCARREEEADVRPYLSRPGAEVLQ